MKDHISEYTEDVLAINQEQIKFDITTSWYIQMTDESHVHSHTHPNSLYTGFVTMDCSEGSIFTPDLQHPAAIPAMFELPYLERNEYNSSTVDMNLAPGEIYILPASMYHSARCTKPGSILSLIIDDVFITGIGGRLVDRHAAGD